MPPNKLSQLMMNNNSNNSNSKMTMMGEGLENRQRLESLQHDIKFVNSLLAQCGLECPFPFSKLIGDPEALEFGTTDFYNLETAARILITLLNFKQRENAFRVEAEDRQRRLNEELDSREILLAKYQNKLEASEREVRSLTLCQQELSQRIKQIEEVAQRSVDEVARLRSSFALKERHFNTELRKREREYEKLKDQLQNCLKEPAAIVNHSNSSVRLENVVASSLDSLFIIEGSEGEVQETTDSGQSVARLDLLEHENANLRQLLASVAQILTEMRKTAQLDGEMMNSATNVDPDEYHTQNITPQISSLPISWIYEKVKEDIETSLSVIGEFLRATPI